MDFTVNGLTQRQLTDRDVPALFALMKRDPQYFSRTQNSPVTEEEARANLTALPPATSAAQKFFIGFFRQGTLAAVLDCIEGYPDAGTVFVGLLMVDAGSKRKGYGRQIVTALTAAAVGTFRKIRLACVRENEAGIAFWQAMRFVKTSAAETLDARKMPVFILEKSLTEANRV